ncbi:MAG: hypothetical protein ACI4EX_12790 [Lachnospiraceae bacterium]
MNITVIIIEILIMFLIFGFIAFGLLYISPLTFIIDYPPEIQEVYYRTQNKEATREKLTVIMKIKKVVALIAFMFLFAWMIHIAGAKTFVQGILLTYAYALALFAWDTFFIDWVLFANVKKIRLPGTEHMDKEYHQKWFHVKVCFPMIPVFAVIGVLSSLIMIWIW